MSRCDGCAWRQVCAVLLRGVPAASPGTGSHRRGQRSMHCAAGRHRRVLLLCPAGAEVAAAAASAGFALVLRRAR